MRLESSAGVWMSWFLGYRSSRTITTVARNQIGAPVARCRDVSWSRWLTRARSHQGQHRRTTQRSPRPARHGLVTLVSTAWSRNSPDEPRVCARHI
jgi:hypothetical protein